MIRFSHSVAQTRESGARIAAFARMGDVFALNGELGAGKTEFVRGFVAALSDAAAVRSPSFSIVNQYDTPLFPVYHFDFYRLVDAAELDEIGFAEYVAGNGVCLVEWGSLFPGALPPHTRTIGFRDLGEGKREIDLPPELFPDGCFQA